MISATQFAMMESLESRRLLYDGTVTGTNGTYIEEYELDSYDEQDVTVAAVVSNNSLQEFTLGLSFGEDAFGSASWIDQEVPTYFGGSSWSVSAAANGDGTFTLDITASVSGSAGNGVWEVGSGVQYQDGDWTGSGSVNYVQGNWSITGQVSVDSSGTTSGNISIKWSK